MKTLWIAILVFCCFGAVCMTGCKDRRARQAAAERRRQEHIEKLRSWVPEEYAGKVEEAFFTYPGLRDWWRFPLVYPYSIETINTLELGWLARTSPDKRVAAGGADVPRFPRITRLAFNGTHLLAETTRASTLFGDPKKYDLKWVLFEFASGEFTEFDDEETARAAAEDAGLDRDAKLEDMETHYRKCFP